MIDNIAYHSLRFDIGVVCIVVVGYIVYHYCLRFDRGVVCIVVVCYIVYHYSSRFERGVVCIVVVGYIEYKLPFCQTLNSNDKQNSLPQQCKPLLCQTINSNDRQGLTEEWFVLLW
jgi:hypothetical protein